MKKRKIQKIMLINPANTMPKDSVRRLTTPLGLLYLGSVLKNQGYSVDILDSPCEGYYQTKINGNNLTYGLSDSQIQQRIKEYNPDIVGVTSMFTAQQNNSIEHCNLVKKVNSEIPVVLGGIHPSIFPEESIKNSSVDYVIMGEGEYRLINLLESLNQNKLPDFDGISYKKNGKSIIKSMTDRIEDLNSLPLPDRSLINMEKYLQIGVPFAPFSRKERVEQIMTTRGCPFDCNFCSTVQYWGHHFRTRNVESIVKEVDELVNKYNIQEIQFSDDNLTANPRRAKEIFKQIKKFNLSWCTPNGLMVQTLDEEMIKLMAESGAYQLSFAIESGNERVREKIINKKVPTKQKVKKLIDIAHENNIQVHGLFIVGFPGETRQEMEETFNYPYETGFDSASFFIANPMPGSRLYKECEEKGYLNPNAKGNVKNAEILIPDNSPDYVMSNQELESLVNNAAKNFKEFTRKKDPDGWDIQYKQFLKRHGEQADLILGRVT